MYIKLILYWVLNTSNVITAPAVGVCEQTVDYFFHGLRNIVIRDYDRANNKLGGEGIIVEIDKSFFC